MLLLVGSDILPMNGGQYFYGSIIVIFGSILQAFLFGNMAALMASINLKDNRMQEHLDNVSGVMRSIKLPKTMQLDIMRYFQYIAETPDLVLELDSLCDVVSPSLKHEIYIYIFKNALLKIDFFKGFADVEISFICMNLKIALYLPQDFVVR